MDIDQYFSGERLYGDDFAGADISEWFEDEREGYANLEGAAEPASGYGYHAVNWHHGFRRLPRDRGLFRHALGVGAAFGHEFQPIAERVKAITILEPSQQLVGTSIAGIQPNYVLPDPSGQMPFEDASFDLVLCFGTLHHIPNISTVVAEMARVTEPGGFLLVREPIISMGDWRTRRPGLTKRERGIPLRLLDGMLATNGLTVLYRRPCFFPATTRLARALRVGPAYNSKPLVRLDAAASVATLPLYRYHATRAWQKLRPTNAFYVAQKIR